MTRCRMVISGVWSRQRIPPQSSYYLVSPNGTITSPLSAPEHSITSHAHLIRPKQNASCVQPSATVAITHGLENPMLRPNRSWQRQANS
jgi:hypothetical protein